MVVEDEAPAEETFGPAGRIAAMPRTGLALTKRAVDRAEDLQGMHAGMDSVFGLHNLAHVHNAGTGGDSLGGENARSMRAAVEEAPHGS